MATPNSFISSLPTDHNKLISIQRLHANGAIMRAAIEAQDAIRLMAEATTLFHLINHAGETNTIAGLNAIAEAANDTALRLHEEYYQAIHYLSN